MRKLVAMALIAAVTLSPQLAIADELSDRQYWIDEYGFSKAWEITRGEGVLVAVIDTGIDTSHPALLGKVVAGKDFSGQGSPDGSVGVGQNSYHGTMVASLIAGEANPIDPSSSFQGAAPEAKLLSASIAFGDDFDIDSQLAEAIYWAVDQGAKVINLSLTRNSTSWPKSWEDAFLYAFEKDVVLVAAVGNAADGTTEISAPATIPGVIAVAGINPQGAKSDSASLSGFEISVAAPAEEIVSAYPDSSWRIWSGSSAASAIVSGLVALVRSAYPELDANGVINRIIRSTTSSEGEAFSTEYGYGVINAERALTMGIEPVSENPLGDLEQWIELYGSSEPSDETATISAPIDSPALAVPNPMELNPSTFLPIAGYAGVGLLALFIYFAFRPRGRGPQ